MVEEPNRGKEYKGEFDFIGLSKPMHEVYRKIRLAAPTETLVHIVGESGTGKELAARALHYNGPRKNGQYITVNCGAIVESLLESELFGHERGAFTGAVGRKIGYLELAKDGTLFLDEIAKIGTAMQNKLLRPLDSYPFLRVGGINPVTTNARIITASHMSLEEAVASGIISEEFYYRIAGGTITLPPLRERTGDISLLAEHFCELYSKAYDKPVKITQDGYEYLESLPWPGNVRQLKRVVETAVVFKEIIPDSQSPDSKLIATFLDRSDFEQVVKQNGHEPQTQYGAFIPYDSIVETVRLRGISIHGVLQNMMDYIVRRALEESKGNQTEAARRLGLTLRQVRYHLEYKRKKT